MASSVARKIAADHVRQCHGCSKREDEIEHSLKPCGKCKSVEYCSRECQKAHWKHHKKVCGIVGQPKSRFIIDRPFTALYKKTWLQERCEEDVYHLLHAVFRLRLCDFEMSLVEEHIAYPAGREVSDLENFHLFLNRATTVNVIRRTRDRILPNWWQNHSIDDCVRFVAESEGTIIDEFLESFFVKYRAMTGNEIMASLDIPPPTAMDMPAEEKIQHQLHIFGEQLDGTHPPCATDFHLVALAFMEVQPGDLLKPENRDVFNEMKEMLRHSGGSIDCLTALENVKAEQEMRVGPKGHNRCKFSR